MPELPEVATVCSSLVNQLSGQRIKNIIIRRWRLRYPIRKDLCQLLPGARLTEISRRAKYLLFHLAWPEVKSTDNHGYQGLIWHLGMSGSFRVISNDQPPKSHDHVDLLFDGIILRYHDPRRFGALLLAKDFTSHSLLVHLGVEPLTDDFSADYLYKRIKSTRRTIKQVLMDHHIVVGIGNIYASEILFAAGIQPIKIACSLSFSQCQYLVLMTKKVLCKAVAAGGSSIKDFSHSDGKMGYFQNQLAVYGRQGSPCYHCQQPIEAIMLGGRCSFYCVNCQS